MIVELIQQIQNCENHGYLPCFVYKKDHAAATQQAVTLCASKVLGGSLHLSGLATLRSRHCGGQFGSLACSVWVSLGHGLAFTFARNALACQMVAIKGGKFVARGRISATHVCFH